MNQLSIREIKESDIDLIIQYWFTSESEYLISLGVDLNKHPTREQLSQMLWIQLNLPIEKKNSYCIIWEIDGIPVGHCNTNPTTYGKEAFMHLHIWKSEIRKKGLGIKLLQMTLPYFFENLKLEKLFCQPYALNPAPNKTLEKIGFDFVKEYVTIPGALNFEQPVKLWELSYQKFKELE
jgi:RimJ/RimL family protein N-acetyltransferase